MSRVRTAWDSTARAVRTVFGHRWLAVAAVVVVVACGGVVAAAYGYDRSQNDMIAKGVHVGSIDIGGLSADAARAKLRRAFKVLHRPLVLRYRSERVVVTGKQARLHLNVDGIVSQALDRSRNGLFLTRAWRQLTGARVQAQLRPHVQYSRAAIRSIVDHLRTKIEKKPVDAQVIPAYDHLTVVGGHPGRAVRASELRWRMRQVLVSRHAKRTLAVPTRVVHPKVTIATSTAATSRFASTTTSTS
jgi:vancomycin resistance protein YoaR